MATVAQDLSSLVAAQADDVVAWRRRLHRNPELSFHEHETSRFIAETLASFGGLEISRPTETSVLARLKGGRPGRTVAIRADIDALPILEENTFEFTSTKPGTMHACGHDGHTAMLLATARILAGLAGDLPGEVRFLFQHAEELPPGGARELIAAGAMQGVDAVIGCHLFSTIPVGQVAVLTGPCMAAADMFALTVKGKGGHGGFPQETVDPIAVAAQVIGNLQHVVSRQTDPLENAVVSVTRIAGGNADNIIPEAVELGGTVRTFRPGHREEVRDAMDRIIRGVTEAHGAGCRFDYIEGYDPVDNDAGVAAVVTEAARAVVGDERVVEAAPIMGGDDFAFLGQEAPGTYFFLGARSEAAGSTFPHHHPRFTVDESAFPIGIETFIRSALELLER